MGHVFLDPAIPFPRLSPSSYTCTCGQRQVHPAALSVRGKHWKPPKWPTVGSQPAQRHTAEHSAAQGTAGKLPGTDKELRPEIREQGKVRKAHALAPGVQRDECTLRGTHGPLLAGHRLWLCRCQGQGGPGVGCGEGDSLGIPHTCLLFESLLFECFNCAHITFIQVILNSRKCLSWAMETF